MANRLGSGAVSTSLAAWIRQFATLALYVVVARSLSPEDLGTFALAASFLLIFEYAIHESISESLVQRADLNPEHEGAALILSFVCGGAIVLLALTFSELLAVVFGVPGLAGILPIMSCGVALICLTSLHAGRLRRAARLNYIAALAAGSALTSIGAAVVLLQMGFGLEALVAYFLLEKAMIALGNVVGADRSRTARPERGHFQDLAPFIIALAGQRSVSFSRSQLDRIAVGIFWGPSVLGAYQLAAKVFESVWAALLLPAAKVFFIAFARLQHDKEALSATFSTALTCVAVVAIPSFVGLSVIADMAVPVMFGQRWGESAILLEIMALAGLPLMVSLLSGALLSGLGKARTFLLVELATAVFGAVILVIVSPFGLTWIALAILAREVLALGLHLNVLRRIVSARDLKPALGLVCLGLSLAMYVGLSFADPWVSGLTSPATTLLLIIFSGIAFYLTALLAIARAPLKEAMAALSRVQIN